MDMPNRNQQADYRYGYQGEYAEEEELGGTHSFELRLWDARIGRWTSPDPYGQFASPYLGMGNQPNMLVDPDGGCVFGWDCPKFLKTASTFLFGGYKVTNYESTDYNADDGQELGLMNIERVQGIFGKIFNRKNSTTWEPDFLNIGDTGLDIGLGIKDFKFGNLAKVNIDLSLLTVKYDKNATSWNWGAGEVSLGVYFGKSKLGGEANVQLFNRSGGVTKFGVLSGGGNLDTNVGANISIGELSIYDGDEGWLNATSVLAPSTPENRMVEIHGRNVPMAIFGGEINYGIGATNVELNIDEIASQFLGGSGLGDNWKK